MLNGFKCCWKPGAGTLVGVMESSCAPRVAELGHAESTAHATKTSSTSPTPGLHPEKQKERREHDPLLGCFRAPRKSDTERTRLQDTGSTGVYVTAVKNCLSLLMKNLYWKQKFPHTFLSHWQQCVYLWGQKEQKFALQPTTKSLDKFSGAENCIWTRL